MSPGGVAGIDVIVVTYESAGVLGECLDRLEHAAPGRGVRRVVVDNASSDGSADLATSKLGAENVVRAASNLGFAAGVNAGIRATRAEWVAVINPDTRVPEGALDALAAVLENAPTSGLAAPRVRMTDGRFEDTVGRFPTLARERAHAFLLDRLAGLEGRHAPFPERTSAVDWVSGCAWLLRRSAIDAIGPLDESYFMYYEDVDYCRRLHDAGWQVLATPDVQIEHAVGRGSTASGRLPADGGAAILRYARKFMPESEAALRRTLITGWRLRRGMRQILAALGDRRSRGLVPRYQSALDQIARAAS